MKQGKRPNRNQKEIISKYNLNFNNWLVVKNLEDEIVVTHRETGRLKTLQKSILN